MNYMTEHEQLSVSEQVDIIMEQSFDQFTHLVQREMNEDAIALGDEFKEWMYNLEQETIIYYNEKEIKQIYRELVKERKRNRG